jgi:hypothetical protein
MIALEQNPAYELVAYFPAAGGDFFMLLLKRIHRLCLPVFPNIVVFRLDETNAHITAFVCVCISADGLLFS